MKTHTVTIKVASSGDFASFGQSVVAYVKKIRHDGRDAYELCNANGEHITTEDSEYMAMQAAQKMNLFPVVVQ